MKLKRDLRRRDICFFLIYLFWKTMTLHEQCFRFHSTGIVPAGITKKGNMLRYASDLKLTVLA